MRLADITTMYPGDLFEYAGEVHIFIFRTETHVGWVIGDTVKICTYEIQSCHDYVKCQIYNNDNAACDSKKLVLGIRQYGLLGPCYTIFALQDSHVKHYGISSVSNQITYVWII